MRHVSIAKAAMSVGTEFAVWHGMWVTVATMTEAELKGQNVMAS